MIDEAERTALLQAAREAAGRAYCPYSKFPVGAAVLTEDDEVFAGCNVENASYGLTICAERNAVFRAVVSTAARLRIKCVLLYTKTAFPTAPCGGCRQVLHEFGPEAEVVCVCEGPEVIWTTVRELLPWAFGPVNLGGNRAPAAGD